MAKQKPVFQIDLMETAASGRAGCNLSLYPTEHAGSVVRTSGYFQNYEQYMGVVIALTIIAGIGSKNLERIDGLLTKDPKGKVTFTESGASPAPAKKKPAQKSAKKPTDQTDDENTDTTDGG